MKEMKESEWKEGADKLKYDGHHLNKILDIQTKAFRHDESAPPDVHVFAKKSVTDSKKLNLTCLATGFYPKDMEIKLRKFTTSLPEHLLRSSGVRPNDDGTYQLRKSVEIQEEEAADYDCYVNHSSINTPVIKQWDGKCSDCQSRLIVGVMCFLLVMLVGVIFFFLKKKGIIGKRDNHHPNVIFSNGRESTCLSNWSSTENVNVNINLTGS
ncbi:class II histocompatibility antigen, B-L beta chain-like [Colossoma macropomum]|uniref:class II histocompatibility antigen, B-L beta chain-like n=1 Tax=Colossoma macropomum TaxID=42526 RepID=UPI00186473F5|nr:class II histocompatibility antigen, B-L beta chain-like [Colossoma macropomum]